MKLKATTLLHHRIPYVVVEDKIRKRRFGSQAQALDPGGGKGGEGRRGGISKRLYPLVGSTSRSTLIREGWERKATERCGKDK